MATDYAGIIPRSVADELLDVVEYQSAAIRLGASLRMPEGLASLPVVSFLPVAGFVNPRFGGRKPATKVEWSAEQIVPEEIACTLAIPSAFVDDAGFPVWEQVRPMAASAIAYALDQAVLFGTGAPASYPAGGVVAEAGAAVSGADALEAIDKGISQVEASGLVPDGIAAGSAIGPALRAEYRRIAADPSQAPAQVVYGLDIAVVPGWSTAQAAEAIVGDWTKLVVGIREDVRFDLSDTAILQDGTGAIIANAFQEDLVAMRCYIRVGVAIGVPVTPVGAGDAFAAVSWGTEPLFAMSAEERQARYDEKMQRREQLREAQQQRVAESFSGAPSEMTDEQASEAVPDELKPARARSSSSRSRRRSSSEGEAS